MSSLSPAARPERDGRTAERGSANTGVGNKTSREATECGGNGGWWVRNFRFFRGGQCRLGTAIPGATDPENTPSDYYTATACDPLPRLFVSASTLSSGVSVCAKEANKCETKARDAFSPEGRAIGESRDSSGIFLFSTACDHVT